ncbi:MAG: matrixin family metalloprotease [Frankiaceae bacterium]|nr:matrixin family metalloprotease [Frankiaceae bacterium]
MRLPLTSPALRRLLAALALGATAAAGPVPAATAVAGGLAEGRDVAPVVVSVGAESAAHWIPAPRRRLATPTLSTSATVVSAPVVAAAPNLTPAHAGSYSFMAEPTAGDPIRWDACGTVHWVFNPANAPAGGLAAVQSAVARVSSATGLHFAYDGTTTAVPSGAYLDGQSGVTGFKPLLIGWSTASASSLLANQPANLVGMNQTIWARPATGATHIVSGVVALNAGVKAATTGGNSWFTFALHELAHGVGLGHTSDATQIMAPTIPAAATDFGSGDLAGLAKLGGTC